MFIIMAEDDPTEHPQLVGIYPNLKAAKQAARNRALARKNTGMLFYVYHVPLGRNIDLGVTRVYMVGWWGRETNTIAPSWTDNEDHSPHLIEVHPLDQLAYDIMNRDPIACDLARDILGRQDL